MSEQEEIRKLKEGLAEWLWHFEGHATSFDSCPIKLRTFWFKKANSLLHTVLADLYIEMPDNSYIRLGDILDK